MKFSCRLAKLPDGRWRAGHDGSLGPVDVIGETRDAALEKLRAELRYRAELCPCTGVSDDYVQLEIVEPGPNR